MNNDPATSSAAHEPTNSNDAQDAVDETTQDTNRRRRRGTRSSSATRRVKAGLAKKLQFMTHLMISLDMLVFAEICVLYYMDCSFFRLIIRSICQYVYLTPKSEELLVLLPSHRFAPPVLAIFIPNVICMLLHIICALPEAGEAARGYLHGGIIIDFVGQKAPTSKFSLLFLDCVVLALQCFMLSVWVERDRLRQRVIPPRGSRNRTQEAQGTEPAAEATTGQDLNSEERGVLRDAPRTADETNDIEMRPLAERNDSNELEDQEDGKEESRALMANSTQDGGSPSLSDVLRSGNAVLADFHVIHALRNVGNDYQSAAAYSLQLGGYTATLAALAAERRAREARRQAQ